MEVGPTHFAVKRHHLPWRKCIADHGRGVARRPVMIVFDDDLGCHHVQHNLLFKMAPSVRDKSARIIGTLFCADWQNFDNWSEPNGALFWGNDLESILVTKNDFQ